jgi:hypothetical protein
MDRVQHQLTRVAAGCAIVLAGGGAACGVEAGARGTETVVDSIIPREVALARFRQGMAEVTALQGGAPTREALVRAFVEAATRSDTVRLRALALTRAEFAWLYYPTTPQALPPYDLAPGLMWSLLELHGAQGLRHLLAELGGRPARYRSHRCDARASVEGANTVYGPCVVRLALDGAVSEERLFGLIIGREGLFKFVSYANKLD